MKLLLIIITVLSLSGNMLTVDVNCTTDTDCYEHGEVLDSLANNYQVFVQNTGQFWEVKYQ